MITDEGIERVRRWGWTLLECREASHGRTLIYFERGGRHVAVFADGDDAGMCRILGKWMTCHLRPGFRCVTTFQHGDEIAKRIRAMTVGVDVAFPRKP